MTDSKKEESKKKGSMMCVNNFLEGDVQEMIEMIKKCCPEGKGNSEKMAMNKIQK